MNEKYKSIIDMPVPTSTKHKRMPVADRAAQFAPFAALTGYEAAVQETGRHTEAKLNLSEDAKMQLDNKMQLLLAAGYDIPATFTYFVPDKRKEGSAYVTVTGCIRKVDELTRTIVLADGTRIPVEDVWEIESVFFGRMEIE